MALPRHWAHWLVAGLAAWLAGQLVGCDFDDGAEIITAPKRLGSYLVIGDWGWDAKAHGNLNTRRCQQLVANAMHKRFETLGDVNFVINVADSFYPDGVSSKDDPQWEVKWRQVYSPQVRGVPWYSIYGNHDYHADPCACTENVTSCAQVNGDISDLGYFYMPDSSWYRAHPEMDLEVIALDLNYYTWVNATCPHTSCPETCHSILKQRADHALQLFAERIRKSTASKWLVFSHYPSDYFPGGWNESIPLEWWSPSWLNLAAEERPQTLMNFLPELSNVSRSSIVYFGGHCHNVDQRTVASISPHTSWLSGGGGGWSTDGEQQGFVVGEIMEDGEVKTYPVLVDYADCTSDS